MGVVIPSKGHNQGGCAGWGWEVTRDVDESLSTLSLVQAGALSGPIHSAGGCEHRSRRPRSRSFAASFKLYLLTARTPPVPLVEPAIGNPGAKLRGRAGQARPPQKREHRNMRA